MQVAWETRLMYRAASEIVRHFVLCYEPLGFLLYPRENTTQTNVFCAFFPLRIQLQWTLEHEPEDSLQLVMFHNTAQFRCEVTRRLQIRVHTLSSIGLSTTNHDQFSMLARRVFRRELEQLHEKNVYVRPRS